MMKRASQKSNLSVFCALVHFLQDTKFPMCSVNHNILKTCVGGIAPRILDIGSENGWILIFTYRPLYPREIGYSACCIREGYHTASLEVEKIKYLLFPGIEHRFNNQAACKIFSPLVAAVGLCISIRSHFVVQSHYLLTTLGLEREPCLVSFQFWGNYRLIYHLS